MMDVDVSIIKNSINGRKATTSHSHNSGLLIFRITRGRLQSRGILVLASWVVNCSKSGPYYRFRTPLQKQADVSKCISSKMYDSRKQNDRFVTTRTLISTLQTLFFLFVARWSEYYSYDFIHFLAHATALTSFVGMATTINIFILIVVVIYVMSNLSLPDVKSSNQYRNIISRWYSCRCRNMLSLRTKKLSVWVVQHTGSSAFLIRSAILRWWYF